MNAIDDPGKTDPRVVMKVQGIHKSFPGVVALDAVSFELRSGEVHALCGENGAGKSTLMKILAGSLPPDKGTLLFKGHPITLASPLEARRKGILLIHQEISLVPNLSVAENIYLGNLPLRPTGRLDHKRLRQQAAEVLAVSGVPVSPGTVVGSLPIALQQMVEIARVLAFNCQVVVFDEPTASLTETEAERLFNTIAGLRARGVAIAYISHKMKEIFRITDRVTVLRDGQVRGTLLTASAAEDEITQLMIGRPLSRYLDRPERRAGADVLAVENLSVPGYAHNVSFTARAGEVLGLYGLVGAGRSEMVEAIFGLREKTDGRLLMHRQPIQIRSAKDAMDNGIGFVPEDRKKQGLVLGLPVRENTALALLRRFSRFGFTGNEREEETYQEFQTTLSIKAATSRVKVGTLSGGNQQKIVLAKWLATRPKLLILDEPTRGIDVGAKAEVHALIGRLVEQGMAVILISSEMPEIMRLSHRILVIQQGRIAGEFDGESATEADLMRAIVQGADGRATVDDNKFPDSPAASFECAGKQKNYLA